MLSRLLLLASLVVLVNAKPTTLTINMPRRQLKNSRGDDTGLKVIVPVNSLCANGAEDDYCSLVGEYMHSDAYFGIPPYGRDAVITGSIVYMTRKADDGWAGCTGKAYSKKNFKPQQSVFLVDRALCTFVSMVREAEISGASAVLIANNKCSCEEKESWAYTNNANFKKACDESLVFGPCEYGLPFMRDDGSGADIKIPSYMIGMWDSMRIKDCLLTSSDPTYMTQTGITCEADTSIIVSLQWDMPSPDNNVEWEIWSSSDADQSFKKEFKPVYADIWQYTTFTPKQFVYDGSLWGCRKQNTDHKSVCGNQCTNAGRYCLPDPDRSLQYGVSGADVLRENLREICIWKQANKTYSTDGGGKFWDYTTKFAENCHGKTQRVKAETFTEACSKEVHSLVGLSWQETVDCVTASGGTEADNTNLLLEAEMNARTQRSITERPSVIINEIIERGAINARSALQTLCAGFKSGTEPDICSCAETSSNPLNCPFEIKCKSTAQKFYCALDDSCKASPSLCNDCPADTPNKCAANGKCYKTADLCSTICDPGKFFCHSLVDCVDDSVRDQCIVCESGKEFWCTLSRTCIKVGDSCVSTGPAPDPNSGAVSGGIGGGAVVLIVLLIVGSVGGVAFVYWRRAQTQMRTEVRNILSEYMPLEEKQGNMNVGLI